ncbi:hypothetical protein Belba_0198 [Belliella baltica DSM 15883]|uniref:Ykud domain-containing protein n=1 Tax=Belliella baltica (strain DSM 15883 / CIP 108006 / LMG 21964 / BA134) TaxID=866536 RepID=I3Z0U9_BELBD|nr:murein L,D-transpeptidase catalytic domain family protein [Belliella baltica]AFL82867.1 hypothetical protein Belba_0198 [Belliella baltica DSM 15883]
MKKITLSIIFIFSAVYTNLISADDVFDTKKLEENILLDVDYIKSNPLNKGYDLPSVNILNFALSGYQKVRKERGISESKPLAVIDFSLPSTQKRLWIIEMNSGEIIHHGFVSHGRNSGDLMAKNFSNTNSSYMSSLGFYLTGETYQGKHGYSLRLDGLEAGFNDKARERAIVIHGAAYAEEEFIQQTGRLGRSLGCPALPQEETAMVIDLIKEQSVLFIYGNDPNYLTKSNILNS